MVSETIVNKIQNVVSSSVADIIKEIDSLESSLVEVKKQFTLETNKLNELVTKKNLLDKEISNEKEEIEKQKREAKEMLASAIAEIEKAKNLSSVVANEVESGEKKIKELGTQIKELTEEYKQVQVDAIEHNNARIKELQEELEKRVPELNKKEKELKNKENDLLIVEGRWKKLFGDKGLGFKV